jgi:transcriptional regulator with XRE-family HTH domain
MPDMPNRVREYREMQRLTQEQLAAKSGLSISQISKIETGKRGWSMVSLEQIASALRVNVSVLFDDSNAWQTVPVFGVVGRGGLVRKTHKHAPLRAPSAFGPLVALLVEGDALYPRYLSGDAIFCGNEPSDRKVCLHRECLVINGKGRARLRTVHPGTSPGRFNLLAYAAAPELDQQVEVCRPVIYTARAGA